MDLNPFSLLKDTTIRWREPQLPATRRIAMAATELPDTSLARLGRNARLAEAEQIRGFLRAGGAAIVRR